MFHVCDNFLERPAILDRHLFSLYVIMKWNKLWMLHGKNETTINAGRKNRHRS